ncbi:MAG: hypothetical protein AAFP16_12145 [Pseudomonadota bacterium]
MTGSVVQPVDAPTAYQVASGGRADPDPSRGFGVQPSVREAEELFSAGST